MFGIRLARALTTAFIDQALKASEEGVAGLSAAMRGLSAARVAVTAAVAADRRGLVRRMTKSLCSLPSADSNPRRRTVDRSRAVAAIDDPSHIRRSRDVGYYLGLVPRRYQSGEVDYTGGISMRG